jgi:pilus assembly protein Flp/PilA
MRKLIAKFAREEDGAAMIEYTVLIGIITVAAIVSIGLVGTWVTGQWGTLVTKLPGAAAPAE